ncbi:HNH endonuclease [Rhizobium leguminosarum]|uniref:HNH endonuclease n=1 Tax=Rhizobium leguminosarum TaxID=384 RepID=UPI0014424C9F|nr:HNH endonuclease [Rhizobium leguminosarum]MBY5870319.1 HNH endonuclease [Rhizobium leguminosarum]NKM09352.1 HNH endonuclease [Rhizobium leguminosarum bv. viciae]
MIDSSQRLWAIPIVTESNLRDAAFDQGYRIGPEHAAGWIFFRSASAPGEIALAAVAAVGPFFLSVQHAGTAREMIGRGFDQATPCAKGHSAAFVFTDLEQLYVGVSQAYRLSMSLPTLPLERFQEETSGLGETEAEAVTRVRIGQNIFRDALMDYWNGVCPLTGITDRELLRASHIIPWADCTSDAQRLDVHNGLLLSSLWDAAFDAGLISFGDDGKPIASPALSDVAAEELSIFTAPPLALTPAHRENLVWHRLHRWIAD